MPSRGRANRDGTAKAIQANNSSRSYLGFRWGWAATTRSLVKMTINQLSRITRKKVCVPHKGSGGRSVDDLKL
jgi:hypothetical protein